MVLIDLNLSQSTMSGAKIANNEELLAAIVTAFDYKITELKEHHARELREIREQISCVITEGDTHRNKVMELLLSLSAAKPVRTKASTTATAGEAMPESASSFWRNNYLGNEACYKSLAENEFVVNFLKSIKKPSLEEITTPTHKTKFATATWDAMVKASLKGVDFDGNEVELNRQTVTEMMQAYIKAKSEAAPQDEALDNAVDGALAEDETTSEPVPDPEPPKPAAAPAAAKPAAKAPVTAKATTAAAATPAKPAAAAVAKPTATKPAAAKRAPAK